VKKTSDEPQWEFVRLSNDRPPVTHKAYLYVYMDSVDIARHKNCVHATAALLNHEGAFGTKCYRSKTQRCSGMRGQYFAMILHVYGDNAFSLPIALLIITLHHKKL
jgi:hypothetical protein